MRWNKAKPIERLHVSQLRPFRANEELSGHILGQRASDLEERVYKALLNNGLRNEDIDFQPSYIAGRNLPGEIRPDFVLYNQGIPIIIFVDEEYFHEQPAQQARDKFNDAVLLERLDGFALIHHLVSRDLDTQEDADRTVREIL